MLTMRRALRENNGVAAVSMAVISTILLLLGRVVTAMLSLEAKLLVLSLLWAGLYNLQRFLVGKRRRSGHWLVQYTAMAAYYLPAPLAFYAASVLYYTSHSHIHKPTTPILMLGVVVMFLATAIVSSTRLGVVFTNMRAYSLRARPGDRYSFLRWLVFLGFVGWESARISISISLLGMSVIFIVTYMILFTNTSESTLDSETKAFADYMKRLKSIKSSSTSPFFDDDGANSNSRLQLLDCCRYPFAQQGGNGEWVTIKDLVHRDDLTNDEDKDICLSYSLCRLLARRYYGFHCAEEGDDKVRRFVLADLGRTNDDYKRAFTIVEVQLAFLHDYFFTSSLPLIESGLEYIDDADMLTVLFSLSISSFVAAVVAAIPFQGELMVRFEMFAMMVYFFGSFSIVPQTPMTLPVQGLLAVYWRPINTAFRELNYLRDVCSRASVSVLVTAVQIVVLSTSYYTSLNPLKQGEYSFFLSDFSMLISFCLVRLFRYHHNPDRFQTQTDGIYWKNKIGQYSILQDYDRRRSPKKALVAWFQRIMLSQPSYKFIKHLPVEEEVDIQNLDKMRELIADTLRSINGPPTNGTRFLKINRDSAGYDWSWTCRQETHTHTILIWHIATCYCGLTPPHSYRHNNLRLVEIDTWYEVAMAMSRYCAYLVAFLPEFLPDHILETKQVFQNVIQDAQRALGSTHMEDKEKHTKFQGLRLPPRRRQTTFHKGVRLGRQLEKLNTLLRWKVMAEFWVETILYVAPSDNAAAHMEHLAKGGEFITHLWAMLSNAGILKRATGEWHPPPASTTKRGPPKKTETEGRTQECPF